MANILSKWGGACTNVAAIAADFDWTLVLVG
jgi:hypothetical protein